MHYDLLFEVQPGSVRIRLAQHRSPFARPRSTVFATPHDVMADSVAGMFDVVQREQVPVSTGIPRKDWLDASVARPPNADPLLGRC